MIGRAQNGPERDFTNAILWQQSSGEYAALCHQAYNFARISLEAALSANNSSKPFCVIVDVDETVLDNARFQGEELKRGRSFSINDWKQWVNAAQADTVPGALSFLQFAQSKGVRVFYVTNREGDEKEATLKNLQQWGFPDAVSTHLLTMDAEADKTQRRAKIAENYQVIVWVGDNLSDFSRTFYQPNQSPRKEVEKHASAFGAKWIILPNPMYGDWQKLLGDSAQTDEAVKSRQRFNHLKGWKETQ